MVALRTERRYAQLAPFALAALFFVLGSTRVGPQDFAVHAAHQPGLAERWRERLIGSPFGTIHAATFSLPRPIGTLVPEPDAPRLARFAPDAESTRVNRSGKGDLLIPRVQIEISAELLREDAAAARSADADDELEVALRFEPFAEYDISLSLELKPQVPHEVAENASRDADGDRPDDDAESLFGAARLYFDGAPMTAALSPIEPWQTGEAPVVMVPAVAVASAPVDAAVSPPAAPDDKSEPAKGGVTVADKGEVTGEERMPKSPAERLKLAGKSRAKAEKCLANAVYFESRSEPVRGQIAVAQVVINRAFSGYYPDDVCGVVYQGANRHLSCQFTFACDGIPDIVTEPEHWARAKRIATAMLDGKIWLNDVGKATHYHASYVSPYWVRSMRRLKKIGLHSFYRPRKWGDGSDEPSWGSPRNTELVAKL